MQNIYPANWFYLTGNCYVRSIFVKHVYIYIYIYICICVYVYMYMCIYICVIYKAKLKNEQVERIAITVF